MFYQKQPLKFLKALGRQAQLTAAKSNNSLKF